MNEFWNYLEIRPDKALHICKGEASDVNKASHLFCTDMPKQRLCAITIYHTHI